MFTGDIQCFTTPTLILQVFENSQLVSLSSASAMQIVLQSPSGGNTTLTAALTTDGTDGKMQATVGSTILTVPGVWKMQGYFVLPGSATPWKTEIANFNVFANLQ